MYGWGCVICWVGVVVGCVVFGGVGCYGGELCICDFVCVDGGYVGCVDCDVVGYVLVDWIGVCLFDCNLCWGVGDCC